MIVAFRRPILLSLDNDLYALQPTIKDVTVSRGVVEKHRTAA